VSHELPSIVSSYIYTLVALTVVSALLLFSLNSYTFTLRNTSETAQLKNILNGVAAKANQILTLVTVTNSSLTVYLALPTTIGDQHYWMRIRNDSSNAWVEGALGQMFEGYAELRVLIPSKPSTSGYFISAQGQALLQGYMNRSTSQLNLASVGG
jgi:hypothetical protein